MNNSRIITVTLHPSIDYVLMVDSLIPYDKNIVKDTQIFYGGKGINTAYALGRLKAKCLAVGIIGEKEHNPFCEKLSSVNVQTDFLTFQGETRTNFKIIDREKGKDTEFNQSGFPVNTKLQNEFLSLLGTFLPNTTWLILSGSLPPGTPSSFYGDLINTARKHGVKTCLDTSGKALAAGVQAQPNMLRINRSELEELAGIDLKDNLHLLSAAEKLLLSGIEMVIISLGKAGAIGITSEQKVMATIPAVAVRNLTGAGDTLTAGFIQSLNQGKSFREALRFGSALATASTLRLEPGDFKMSEFAAILENTIVHPL